MSIKQTILNEAQKEVDQILAEAKEEHDKLLTKNKQKIDTKIASLKSNATKEQARIINEKEIELENETKKIVLEEKNVQINKVLNKFKDHLLNLNDKDFFNYVVNRIKQEEVSGDEVMRTNAKEYSRYLKLFSSQKKADLVVLDKLNKALGSKYNLKLESEPVGLDNGFLLIGEHFDLNFSIEPLIESIKRTTEKQIHDILYKE